MPQCFTFRWLYKIISRSYSEDRSPVYKAVFELSWTAKHCARNYCLFAWSKLALQLASLLVVYNLDWLLINEKQIYAGYFLRKQERETALNKTKFNNVYVKNCSESTTDKDLKTSFGEYDEITSAVIMRDADGKSKCFGFVNSENADDAIKATEAPDEEDRNEEKEKVAGKM